MAEQAAIIQDLTDWLSTFTPPSETTDLTASVEPRRWVVADWLPAGRVTRLSSHGGSGKSYLALELAAAVASGQDPDDAGLAYGPFRALHGVGPAVLSRRPAVYAHDEARAYEAQRTGTLFRLADNVGPRRVFFMSWEDERAEFRRRTQWLPSRRVEHLADRLRVIHAEGRHPLWGPRGRDYRDAACGLTRNGGVLEAEIREASPALVILDPVAAAFAGNENDRAAVRQWLSHLNALARETGAAILLISHPPKHSGHTYSGSTDWDNGVRAAWSLDPEVVPGVECEDADGKYIKPRGLALTLTKSNYSRAGLRLWLRWDESPKVRGLIRCTPLASCEAWHQQQGLPAPRARAGHNAEDEAPF